MLKRRRRANKEFVTYFHRGDWKSDPGVTMLNSFEKGVWLEIILWVDAADPRGYAVDPAGRPLSVSQLAENVKSNRDNKADVEAAIRRLVEIGVASVDFSSHSKTRGAIFCRRIVRDEAIRKQNSKNGKKGGNPNLKASQRPIFKSQKERNLGDSVGKADKPQYPISNSPVSSKEEDTPIGVSKKKGRPSVDPHELPEDFVPSEKTVEWLQRKCPNVDIDWELRRFKNHFRAASNKKTYLKKDWQLTFENWCMKEEKEHVQRKQFETAADKKDRGVERALGRLAASKAIAGVADNRSLQAPDGHTGAE